jgi:tetratricopeptide (TPR) repeat protein
MDLDSISPDELYAAAQESAASGKYADAIQAYSSAIDGDPGHISARVGRGMAFQRVGEHTRAIADFDEVISCYPDWPGAFVAYYSRAVSQQALGENIEAVKDCDEAISRNPELADAFYVRGTAQKALGYIDAAVNDMDAVLNLNHGYSEAYLERGKLSYFQHRWQQAIEDFSAAIEHIGVGSQYLRECFYLRGMAAQELGEHRAAIADFTRIIDLVPNDGAAYLRRARSYHELGERASGDADFQVGTRLMHGQ